MRAYVSLLHPDLQYFENLVVTSKLANISIILLSEVYPEPQTLENRFTVISNILLLV